MVRASSSVLVGRARSAFVRVGFPFARAGEISQRF
jgi:hypothetical protein